MRTQFQEPDGATKRQVQIVEQIAIGFKEVQSEAARVQESGGKAEEGEEMDVRTERLVGVTVCLLILRLPVCFVKVTAK